MSALQQVTLQLDPADDLLELEQIASGYHVVQAHHCREIAIRNKLGPRMIAQWNDRLMRLVLDLMTIQCSEVYA